MADTTRIVGEGISLRIPGYVKPSLLDRGSDSSVSCFEGGGITIIVDEGPFSDPLTSYADKPRYHVSFHEIGGHMARMVHFENEEGVHHLGVRFLDIADTDGGKRAVTIVAHVVPESALSIARQILESTSFVAHPPV